MLPWEQVNDLWATKSKDVGLIVHVITFQGFQSMWSWSTNVTDRQTGWQTTCGMKICHSLSTTCH